MSTRRKTDPGPLSQNRYMSSNEFSELRGVSGVAASARAAVLLEGVKRNFIWWLQGLSLTEGGLKRVARELVEMFPDRIAKDDKQFALGHEGWTGNEYAAPQNLEQFMVDLCINPRIHFKMPDDDVDVSDIETDRIMEENPGMYRGDFGTARLNYFKDIIGALFEYKALQESKAKANFQITTIGKKIWETLDFALVTHGMVLLDGMEGRGKTEAVKAWCEIHLGAARFVSLKGITNKTTAFREIARALGIASSYTRTAPEMQARIEDVLKRSRLMLVMDEAHFIFNQSRRMYSRPELADWIYTALCNQDVPIALVTTPQFILCMTRAADQVEWNYRQFRRRVKRWEILPAANSQTDIAAVAKHVFKSATPGMILEIAGYADLSGRDLSAVGDVADEVRAMLGSDDLTCATPKQVHRAIYDFLLPSDKNFVDGMKVARSLGRKPGRRSEAACTEAPAEEPAPEEQPTIAAGRSRVPALVLGSRTRVGNEASLIEA